MAFSAADFADDTDFERFILDRLGTHRVRVASPGAIHDHRGAAGHGHVIIGVGAAEGGGRRRQELRQSLRPVGFGAAYKILDLLVEHVLRANGHTSIKQFATKTAALAQQPTSLPVPLDSHPGFWDRMASLYGNLQEARHAVTHRRTQVTPGGDLEIYDNQTQIIDTVTSAEIASFVAAVHALAEGVIGGVQDERQINIVAWHLNALQPRHGSPALSASDPDAGRRLLKVDLTTLDDGRLRFEVGRARAIVDVQESSIWDLELHAEDRVFVGRWEDVPDRNAANYDFHPASPPSWLSEELS
jgi:hypothetical protein